MSASIAAVAAMAARRRKVVDALLARGADSAATALDPTLLSAGERAFLPPLQRQGVVRTTTGGRVFVDRGRMIAHRAAFRRGAIIAVSLGLAAGMAAVVATVLLTR